MSSDLTSFSLFESFERIPASHAETVNRKAYQKLWDALSVPQDQRGRCILLRAPRAGHGKTHMLARLNHNLGVGYEFIPIYPSDGAQVDASSVLEDVLRRLTRSLAAGGGLTVLDLYARRLFATGLQPLVRSGEVPCQDREGALAALRNRPIETFDFHHPNAVTAHWTKENIEVLGPRLSLELSQTTGSPLRETAFWIEHLFRFASSPLEQPGRSGLLIQNAVGDTALSHPSAMERLACLLALLSLLVRVVLVADELEGFSADDNAALRFSAFLGAVRHGADRLDVIVSVNRDVWESAFLPRLSGGLSDRLSEIAIDLDPLADEEIIALLDSRLPGAGARLLASLGLGAQDRYARKILREASDILQKQTLSEPAQQAPASTFAPAPIEVPIAYAATSITQPTPPPVVEPVTAVAPQSVAPAVTVPTHEAAGISAPVRFEPAPVPQEEVPVASPPRGAPEEVPPVRHDTPQFADVQQSAPASPFSLAEEPKPVAPQPFQEAAPVVRPEPHHDFQEPVYAYSFQAPVVLGHVQEAAAPATPGTPPQPLAFSQPPTAPSFFQESAYTAPPEPPVFPPHQAPAASLQHQEPALTAQPEPQNSPPPVPPVSPSIQEPAYGTPPEPPPTPVVSQPRPEQGEVSPEFDPSHPTFNVAAALAIWQQQTPSPFGVAEEEPVSFVTPPPSAYIAPEPVVETPQPPPQFVPAVQPAAPPVAYQEPVAAVQPLQATAIAQPKPEPAFQPAPADTHPATAEIPSTDRVDDLLRQFRERYGRG